MPNISEHTNRPLTAEVAFERAKHLKGLAAFANGESIDTSPQQIQQLCSRLLHSIVDYGTVDDAKELFSAADLKHLHGGLLFWVKRWDQLSAESINVSAVESVLSVFSHLGGKISFLEADINAPLPYSASRIPDQWLSLVEELREIESFNNAQLVNLEQLKG